MAEFTSKHFLGLNQHNHYVTPTMEKYNYDRPSHMLAFNDILRSKHYDELDRLPGNIIKVANTCQKYTYISTTLQYQQHFKSIYLYQHFKSIYIYQQHFHQEEQTLIFLALTKSYVIYV